MKTTEQSFQDYLDDRMTAEEREAFEHRLKRDPELSERLADHLELREALREEEALPPGFYTRTRAEFERRHRRRKPVSGLLSWEALGLAAAAGLALALFVPGLLREGLPQTPSTDEAVRSQRWIPPETASPAAVADDEAEEDRGVEEMALEEAEGGGDVEERQTRARPAKPSVGLTEKKKEVAPTPTGRGDAAGKQAAAPVEEKTAPPPVTDAPRPERFAPSPPAPKAQALPPPPPPPRENAAKSMRRSRLASSLEQEASRAIRATPLLAGAVPRYAVRPLGSQDVRSLIAGTGEDPANLLKDADAATAAPERQETTEALVLIGARDTPFSCEGMRVRTQPNEYVVYLGAVGPGRPAAVGGCAVYLPVDDRAILVVDP